MFENRVLRRIFGPKRQEVVGSWRRLHNEELRNLYAAPMEDNSTQSTRLWGCLTLFSVKIIRVVKSRRGRWTGHEASIGAKRNAYKFFYRKT
jgi:hypothetical protein